MVRIPYTYPDDEKKYDARLRHSFPIPTKRLKLVSGTYRVRGMLTGGGHHKFPTSNFIHLFPDSKLYFHLIS